MDNAISWALAITGATLIVTYLVATPGLLLLSRHGAFSIAAWFTPAFAVAAWWALFLGGFGQQSPFNINELFYLGAAIVLVVYSLLILVKVANLSRSVVVPMLSAALASVVALRTLMPAIGE